MGVLGLKSFVEERDSFFTELQVRDTKLVVDGSSLYHYLCFASDSDLRRGGDYGSFAAAVSEFFDSLRRCRISPFVVLDGGRDPSDRKLPLLRERAADRLRKACSLSRGGGGQVAPLLTREAFVQALRRLAVPFVQCFAEADREIAGLASRWGCPVLSLDSDFCVFDLPGGYCPLNHFQWQSVGAAEEPRGCYVPARRFSVERFCEHFAPLHKSLLPLFAVMSGNDYVCLARLEAFYSRARLAAGGGARHGRLRALLRWLAQFPRPAQALDGVLEHLQARRREEVRQLLCAAMEDYAPSEVKLEDFFAGGRYECAAAGSAGLPQWVRSALARGRLDPFVSNVLVLRSIFLRVQVENMRRPSAHGAALPIRQVIYGLLLREPRGRAAAQPPVVCEFGRLQTTVHRANVRAASVPTELCGDPFPLDTLTEVPLSCRQALLLETLGVQMSSLAAVPSHLQLPAAVTCYWLRCSEPPVKSHQLKALLLMLVAGELHRTTAHAGPPVSPAEDDSVAYNQFVKWKEKQLPREEFDLDAAHSFCQWQCCLQMGLYLNQLLSAPLAEPDLSRLYSGTLVHRLCQELKSAASVENLFSASQRLAGLYQLLLRTVEAAVAPAFQKMATAPAGSCRKKKASGKKKKPARCAGPGAQQLCSGNRFAALQGED
ncbi:single-strand DNA endonuclease ASTE1 [Melanerpes formicivorus]|uniref:single-strand DNA endonuclease ASTE1 n=1 Tax=Melanerpes formicivorus TaxID=211600 RepID=UPI003590077C